jgi:GGDEF domain-containing protein
VSVGIASHPKDAETIGTRLYAADRALYAMKDKRLAGARARPAPIKNANILEKRKSNG